MSAAATSAGDTLRVRGLRVELPGRGGAVPVLDGVDLRIGAGECVALVGESGSGKTTLALACAGLLPEGSRVEGRIELGGRDVTELRDRDWDALRGAAIGFVFQEPSLALDPVMRVGRQVAESLEVHGIARGDEARRRVVALLAECGLPRPEALLHEVPHRLSGGMRQRVALAAALVAEPRLLVADEPTTALDASLRAHVLRLLERRRRERGLSVLLVSHDLASVGRHADRIVVLYAGRVAEEGPAAAVLREPRHPYTRALVACAGAAPRPIPGRAPSPGARPEGCAFHPRCERRAPSCAESVPAPESWPGDPARRVACPVVAQEASPS